jgi:type II secretory pathway component GspD/PulD (secretin)
VSLPLAALMLGAPQAPRVQLPPLPLTQLDQGPLAADLDGRTFSLTFGEPVAVGDLLLLLVRGTSLSIVPAPGVTGSFIGELKDVTVRQALTLILPPLGLDYDVQGSFIKVFPRAPETRIFDLNFSAAERIGASVVGETGVAAITTSTKGDVFGDIEAAVRGLLSEKGVVSVERKAGLLQVTDFPERLTRVSEYLDTVRDRVHRQVQIDARVIEVELDDAHTSGLDWEALARAGASPGAGGGSPGVRVRDVPRLLDALTEQGVVSTLASPRLLALNNEPAVVRGTVERAGQAGQPDGVTLTVTPQIAQNGMVTLAVGPVVTLRQPDEDPHTPDVVMVRALDTLARVANGETLVVSGFHRTVDVKERRSGGGFTGGWFGRSTVVVHKRVELLVLLTPTIVNTAAE